MSNPIRSLNRPLFGTVVVPADARVDPHSFPESEYPLHCPQCDYLLRGLSENRCPECGESFDRGRLLVDQYVLRTTATRTPERRILVTLAVLSILVVAIRPITDHFVLTRYWNNSKSASAFQITSIYFAAMQILLGTLLTAFTITAIWMLRRWRAKSRQREAILSHLAPGSNPTYPDDAPQRTRRTQSLE